MKQFTYTIADTIGIHARPTGLLAKAAKELDSEVTIAKSDGTSASAAKLLAVMRLAIKEGEKSLSRWKVGMKVQISPPLSNSFGITCNAEESMIRLIAFDLDGTPLGLITSLLLKPPGGFAECRSRVIGLLLPLAEKKPRQSYP